MSKILPAGTKILCAIGHEVATVARDLTKEDGIMMPDQFKDWRIEQTPEVGKPVNPACKCGSPWLSNGKMFVEGGMWP